LSYLGREGVYTETGFIGFDTLNDKFPEFLKNYLGFIRHGWFKDFARWHDCEAFDFARVRSGISGSNLSPFFKIPENKKMSLEDLDVMGRSILGEYLFHAKGKRKDAFESLTKTMHLISEPYRATLKKMNAKQKNFGCGSKKRREYIKSLGYEDILDYGCGKGKLGLGRKYDPALPHFAADPEPADLLVSTDVLEHIEPDFLDNVLTHMKSKMKKAGYFTIGCAKAAKKLPDGRNAHLIVQPPEWWLDKLAQYFTVVSSSTHRDSQKRADSMELEVHVRNN
jgi:hypothetical protein